MEVSFLAEISKEDARSTTAGNLHLIQEETGLDPLNTCAMQVKMEAKKIPIPKGQEWRISTLEFLLKERKERESKLENTQNISFVIDALCSM